MPSALHVPRVNNNDDEVKLVNLTVKVGELVAAGQTVAEVETDKAVVEVEATEAGHVLAVLGTVGDVVRVGSVLLWLGQSADEAVPTVAGNAAATIREEDATGAAQPTAKARLLLQRHGLQASEVTASGSRLSVADVERHLAATGLTQGRTGVADAGVAPEGARQVVAATMLPTEPGSLQALRGDERGMLATVTWHRDVAVAGYIELPYEATAWESHAKQFNDAHALLLNPLLPLMAWSLARLATGNRRLNATITGNQRLEYDQVNLGFTVQAGSTLYLAVVRNAGALSDLEFVNQLVDLQRRAAGHHLSAQETQGTTVGFSSMARWKIGRHIPVLAPHTALMVAHTVDGEGRAVLGATYDHRVMHGADVAQLLRSLSKPPSAS